MTVKVAIACHKKCETPADELYIPVHAGRALGEDIGFVGDNTGDNISEKNRQFCELTVLYWASKNLDADYIGLAHYRRHFSAGKKQPLTAEEAAKLIEKAPVVLPKKRRYYIETLYKHYDHTMYVETLDGAGEIIAKRYPEYLPQFNLLKKRTSAHMFNMMIMRRDLMQQYCEWLFDILFELEQKVPPTKYSAFHARYPGRVSELLLDVWLNTNKIQYTEVGYLDAQGINWFKKGAAFLKAKFFAKKYDKSF